MAEGDDGQISFDLFSAPAPEHGKTSAAESVAPQAEEENSRAPWWDELNEIRDAHPDNIILYQMGDFFELYGEDAKTAADLLGLTLTTRPVGGMGRVELCGFPAHMAGSERGKTAAKSRRDHCVCRPRRRGTQNLHRASAYETNAVVETSAPINDQEATVTAEEAPLLKRLMDGAGIEHAQFVHDNGDVTFSFTESDRDAVENLIAKLRTELTKAVSATYAAPAPQSPNTPGRN